VRKLRNSKIKIWPKSESNTFILIIIWRSITPRFFFRPIPKTSPIQPRSHVKHRMSHVRSVHESCHKHECDMSRIWMRHSTHNWIIHVPHMNVSWHAGMSCVTHMNESCKYATWLILYVYRDAQKKLLLPWARYPIWGWCLTKNCGHVRDLVDF